MSRPLTPTRGAMAIALAVALAACGTVPSAPPPHPTALPDGVTPQQMVASIRAAAASKAGELDVQPLRDGQVEDLRQQAAAHEARGQYQEATALLQQALAVNPDDPAVMQEAAELAVLLWQFDQAEQLARRAHALGSGVGPLCRRHWATVEQVTQARLALATAAEQSLRADAAAPARAASLAALQAGIDSAQQAREACTVSAPQRF